MADDVRDGVGLAGSGRPLNHYTIGHFQHLNDANLFVVEGLGKVKVACLFVSRGSS